MLYICSLGAAFVFSPWSCRNPSTISSSLSASSHPPVRYCLLDFFTLIAPSIHRIPCEEDPNIGLTHSERPRGAHHCLSDARRR